MDLTGQSPDKVLLDFMQHQIGSEAEEVSVDEDTEAVTETPVPLVDPDGELLAHVVRGAVAQRELLDEMVGGSLSGDWTVDRLEPILLAILRCGAFELLQRPDVPTKVVITEYLDVAHAFYSGSEPKLVNAVLDRISKVARDSEGA